MRISDWSSDVCSSDLEADRRFWGGDDFGRLRPVADVAAPESFRIERSRDASRGAIRWVSRLRSTRAERGNVCSRPIAADPPRNGEGDHRRWWRGTGGAALRIKDRKHLDRKSTRLNSSP